MAETRGKLPTAYLTEASLQIQHDPMSRIDKLLPQSWLGQKQRQQDCAPRLSPPRLAQCDGGLGGLRCGVG